MAAIVAPFGPRSSVSTRAFFESARLLGLWAFCLRTGFARTWDADRALRVRELRRLVIRRPSRLCRRNARRHCLSPAEAHRRWRGREGRAHQGSLLGCAHTHALFAQTVKRKLSNSVCFLAAPASSPGRQKSRQFLPTLRMQHASYACAEIAGGDILSAWLEVHDPAAAAQRRQSLVAIFDQTRPQLSPRSQIFSPTSAQTLISEFESYMPSHAVGLTSGRG
jgi:hypothetical protein